MPPQQTRNAANAATLKRRTSAATRKSGAVVQARKGATIRENDATLRGIYAQVRENNAELRGINAQRRGNDARRHEIHAQHRTNDADVCERKSPPLVSFYDKG